MSILNNQELSDIITWHPNGKGFTVLDKIRLVTEVLPMYFKEAKFSSFNRRLKRWNFCIQRHGHKMSSYFHPHFIRGDLKSILKISPSNVPKKNSPSQSVSENPGDGGTTAASSRGVLLIGNSEDPPSDVEGGKVPMIVGNNLRNHDSSLVAVRNGTMERRGQTEQGVSLLQSFRLQQPHRDQQQLGPIPAASNTIHQTRTITASHYDATRTSAMPSVPFRLEPQKIQEYSPNCHGASIIVPPSLGVPSQPSSSQNLRICEYHHNPIDIPTPVTTSINARMSMHHLYQQGRAGLVGPNPTTSSHVIVLPPSNSDGNHWPYFPSSSTATYPSAFARNSVANFSPSPAFNQHQYHQNTPHHLLPGIMFAQGPSSSIPSELMLANHAHVYHPSSRAPINGCYPIS